MDHVPPPGADSAPSSPLRAIGEVALRVEDLEETTRFYREVVGLSVLRSFEDAVFFALGESHGGHTQVLALFDRRDEADYVGLDAERTTVDHLAFAVDAADFDAEAERLAGLGVDLAFAFHDWVAWRSLYFTDPEGNRLEFVCYDPEGGKAD